jgi:hypothetical protein
LCLKIAEAFRVFRGILLLGFNRRGRGGARRGIENDSDDPENPTRSLMREISGNIDNVGLWYKRWARVHRSREACSIKALLCRECFDSSLVRFMLLMR